MGLLDSIANQVSSALAGSATSALPNAHPGLLEVVTSLLGNAQSGGLQGLVGRFEQQGLGPLIASWIGPGENLAITPEQVQSVLGSSHIEQVAGNLGLSASDVTNQLAGLLPHAVDVVTPGGAMPQGSAIDEALNLLSALRR